jgi:hypothetical protein
MFRKTLIHSDSRAKRLLICLLALSIVFAYSSYAFLGTASAEEGIPAEEAAAGETVITDVQVVEDAAAEAESAPEAVADEAVQSEAAAEAEVPAGTGIAPSAVSVQVVLQDLFKLSAREIQMPDLVYGYEKTTADLPSYVFEIIIDNAAGVTGGTVALAGEDAGAFTVMAEPERIAILSDDSWFSFGPLADNAKQKVYVSPKPGLDAGTYSASIVITAETDTPEDSYTTSTTDFVEVHMVVEQAEVEGVFPLDYQLVAFEGQTLDWVYAHGWEWDEPVETPIGPVGINYHPATYIPEDTVNYKPYHADLPIEVVPNPHVQIEFFDFFTGALIQQIDWGSYSYHTDVADSTVLNVTNNGSMTIHNITAEIDSETPEAFDLSELLRFTVTANAEGELSLAPGETIQLIVSANNWREPGTYSAWVKIHGEYWFGDVSSPLEGAWTEEIGEALHVTYTVQAPTTEEYPYWEEVEALLYLGSDLRAYEGFTLADLIVEGTFEPYTSVSSSLAYLDYFNTYELDRIRWNEPQTTEVGAAGTVKTASYTVYPKDSRYAPKTYTIDITVLEKPIASSFLEPAGNTIIMDPLTEGYSDAAGIDFKLWNLGELDITYWDIYTTGDISAFTVTTADGKERALTSTPMNLSQDIAAISPGTFSTHNIKPVDGLAAGTYTVNFEMRMWHDDHVLNNPHQPIITYLEETIFYTVTFTVDSFDKERIALSTEDAQFDNLVYGYENYNAPLPSYEIDLTVLNESGIAFGSIGLSNDEFFTLDTGTLPLVDDDPYGIAAMKYNQTATFSVSPKPGLGAGTYDAEIYVVVNGADNTWYDVHTVKVHLLVEQADTNFMCGYQYIAFEGQTMGEVPGYGWTWDEPADTPVGPVGRNSHPATFVPEDPVNYKTYQANLSVEVYPQPAYGISFSDFFTKEPIETIDLGTFSYHGDHDNEQVVNVTNNGNMTLHKFNMQVYTDTPDAFNITTMLDFAGGAQADSLYLEPGPYLAPGESLQLIAGSNSWIEPGTYTAKIVVSGEYWFGDPYLSSGGSWTEQYSETITVTFTVKEPAETYPYWAEVESQYLLDKDLYAYEGYTLGDVLAEGSFNKSDASPTGLTAYDTYPANSYALGRMEWTEPAETPVGATGTTRTASYTIYPADDRYLPKTYEIEITVIPRPILSSYLDPGTSPVTIAKQTEGYTNASGVEFKYWNTGNLNLEFVEIGIHDAPYDAFSVKTETGEIIELEGSGYNLIESIAPGTYTTFTVFPKDGLAPGTYTIELKLFGTYFDTELKYGVPGDYEYEQKSVTVTFTVEEKPTTPTVTTPTVTSIVQQIVAAVTKAITAVTTTVTTTVSKISSALSKLFKW